MRGCRDKTLMFLVNDLPFFVSHRLPLAIAAKEQGYVVHVATAPCVDIDLTKYGVIFHELPLTRSGRSLFGELRTFFSVCRVIRNVRPDLLHVVTIKPVLYGGMAARLLGVSALVSAVSGLGSVFIARGWRARVFRQGIRQIYRLAFGHPNQKVIFQNPDDQNQFIQQRLVASAKTSLIRGSGVDLDQYPCEHENDGSCVVTMVARLLIDKGIVEFVEAARILAKRQVNVVMQVVGDIDPGNPATVTAAQLDQWKVEGAVRFLGYRTDVARIYAESHIACLPSYREGLPKSLIEAAACGRAVITTDAPGCRFAIEPEKTGLLVPVRDSKSLADAIQYLVEHPEKRKEMGLQGRLLAEREFSIEGVVASHLEIYKELLENK